MLARRTIFLAIVVALPLSGCVPAKVRTVQKSMEPTIRSGEYVLLDEDAYAAAGPQVGDIVSARAPLGADTEDCGERPRPGAPCRVPTPELSGDLSVVKRVAALGGQRIAIDGKGRPVVDGERRYESSVILCLPEDLCALRRTIRVPAGHVFLLGDNRPYSSDSRSWGPVPLSSIEGRVAPP